MPRYGENDLECKIYVGDLARDCTEKDLERAFSYYGALRNVWVARNPPGFAFVEYEDGRDAEDAVRGLDGTSIAGARVRVEKSTGKVRPKPWQRGNNRDSRDSRGPPRMRRPFDSNDRCYECGEHGHYAYDCPRSGRRGGGGGGGGGGSSGGGRSRRSRSRSYERRGRSRSRSRGRYRSRSFSRSPSRDRYRSRSRSGSRSPAARAPRSRSRSRSRGSPGRNDKD